MEHGHGRHARMDARTHGALLLLVVVALCTLATGLLMPLVLGATAVAAVGAVVGGCMTFLGTGAFSWALIGKALLLALALVMAGVAVATLGLLGRWGRTALGKPLEPGVGLRLLRLSWWALGVLLCGAFCGLVPAPRSGQVSQAPLLAATVLFALAAWSVLTVAAVSFRLSWSGLAVCWRAARRSPLVAKLVLVAGLVAALVGASHPESQAAPPRSVPAVLGELCATSAVAGIDGPQMRALLSADLSTAPAALFERRGQPVREGQELQTVRLRSVAPGALGNSGGVEGLSEAESSPRESIDKCVRELHQYRSAALRIASSIVGDGDAHDVVQDIIIRICFRPLPRELEPYFKAAVWKRALEWRRRAVRSDSLSGEVLAPACTSDPVEALLRAEHYHVVNRALRALSEADQEVLWLRLHQELGYPELARELGTNEAAARQRVSRALKRMQAEIGRSCAPELQ